MKTNPKKKPTAKGRKLSGTSDSVVDFSNRIDDSSWPESRPTAKKKVVKAWAVLNKRGEVYAVQMWSDPTAVPCTISYSPPRRQRNGNKKIPPKKQ